MLARLRAHYPEHQHKEEEEEREDERGRATRSHPSHHRHSTTHNDTTHNDKTRTATTHEWRANGRHHHHPTNHHHHSTITRHYHKDTTLNQQCCDNKHSEGWGNAKKGEQNNTRRQTQSNTGDTTTHTLSPFNKGHRANGRGTLIPDGRVTITTPALPKLCHPPLQYHPTIHDSHPLHHNEGGMTRGYPTTRTPHKDTHPPTPHTWQRDSTRHDSST